MSDTNEPSLLPWHLEGKCIYTAHGDFIGEMEHTDDARFVVDAVNAIDATKKLSIKLYDPIRRAEAERDRLRDIVRRLVEYADAVTGYRPRTIEVLSSEHPAWTFDGAALLREARAAIGEGQP